MGLDIYVGTLTRYYSGDWKTIVQQHGEQMGFEVQMLRANDPEDAVTDPAELQPWISEWRSNLANALAEHLDQSFTWNESHEAPYFTDKPAWDCYLALIQWACYAEHPDLSHPAIAAEDISADPSFQRSASEDFDTQFRQLVDSPEIWFPVPFDFTFQSADAGGNEMMFGSSPTLLDQLNELNSLTWNASQATIDAWRHDGAEHRAPFETSARFGFAVMHTLATKSVEHKLPMRQDY